MAPTRKCQCGSESFGRDHSNATGDLVCLTCGVVMDSNYIVSEVQFGESSSGAAMVQGSIVGSDQARAPIGGRQNAMESREQTKANAKRKIRKIALALNIPGYICDAAVQTFNLALAQNFVQGRRSSNVIAACLYFSCRMERTHHMLIDFSSALQISVYSLGATFLKLVKQLRKSLPLADPSLFIQHFAERLKFGNKTIQVVRDAVKLADRMSGDWIQYGRRPAGIAGACLMLAARMNGFRRTYAEVVAVSHVAEETIQKRLNEFGETNAGSLSIKQFRESQDSDFAVTADPPSFQKNRQKERDLKRRVQWHEKTLSRIQKYIDTPYEDEKQTPSKAGPSELFVAEADAEADAEPEAEPARRRSSRLRSIRDNDSSTKNDAKQKASHVESENVANEEVAKQPEDSGEVENAENNGRAAQEQNTNEPDQGVINDEAVRAENNDDSVEEVAPEITDMISEVMEEEGKQHTLAKKRALKHQREELEKEDVLRSIFQSCQLSKEDLKKELARIVKRKTDADVNAIYTTPAEEEHLKELEERIQTNWPRNLSKLETSSAFLERVPDDPIGSDDDDDEIEGVVLSHDEFLVKQNIWMGINADYVQAQEAKRLKAEADELTGNTSGQKRKRRKKKDSDDADDAEINKFLNSEGGLQGAAEQAGAMLQKKSFSKKINYNTLSSLFQ
ncbi:transcription factor IIIB 70 kDa subunit [Diutina rugosa]